MSNKEDIEEIKGLVPLLNEAADAYYNTGNPIMSDGKYDMLFDRLLELEAKTGFVLANSPTHNVGAPVLDDIPSIEHDHPMLSLDKCHTCAEIAQFRSKKSASDCSVVASIKADGLSMSLRYEDGKLVRAETRGNGFTGSDVTEHAKQFDNIPMIIPKDGVYVIDGEAVILQSDFEKINAELPENSKFANARNLASGTLGLHDMSIVKARHMRFYAWRVVEEENASNTYIERFEEADNLGFQVIPYFEVRDGKDSDIINNDLLNIAKNNSIPCDGVVWVYNNVSFGDSLGATEHHPRYGIAFKPQVKSITTHLRKIEYQVGRTGKMTPVAVFDPIELDGSVVTKSTLHNIAYCKQLELGIGDEIVVSKHNFVIPAVDDNITRSGFKDIPSVCPYCGAPTKLVKSDNSEELYCTNKKCTCILLQKFVNFVSKNAMNIKGLSEQTLKDLLNRHIVKCYADLYTEIKSNKNTIAQWSGYGLKSVNSLIDSIEASRNVSMAQFLVAIGIPNVGKGQAKVLAKRFKTFKKFIAACEDGYDFSNIDGIGNTLSANIIDWYYTDYFNDCIPLLEVQVHFTDATDESNNTSRRLNGKSFCITGKLLHHENRDAFVDEIEALGGKYVSSVSKNTDYLINNDITSTSGKNKKAQELGIPIITEDQFRELFIDAVAHTM